MDNLESPLPVTFSGQGVFLRDARDDDLAFMQDVFAESRQAEMSASGWRPEMIAAFLADQFRLQTLHYRNHYLGALWLIVEVGGEPAGRVVLFDSEEETRVVDIALLARFRGAGLGTAVMKAVQARALSRATTLVSLHVELHNPARRLYGRLGFSECGRCSDRMRMEWRTQAKMA